MSCSTPRRPGPGLSSVPLEDASSNENLIPSQYNGSVSLKQLAATKSGTKWWNWRVMLSNYWVYEFACGLFALICLTSITIVLSVYDAQEAPTWRYGITLNTIVSLLASFTAFSLFVPLGAALSQAKWLWFNNRSRPLIDFETIEDASHGPAGGINLLVKWNTGWLARMGAILVVMLLAIDPFLQQLVKSGAHFSHSSQAAVPVIHTYNPLPSGLDQFKMLGAVQTGLFALDNISHQFDVTPSCPTGNCTWPEYQTLAVCSMCADLTNDLIPVTIANPYDNNGTVQTVGLPNGITLNPAKRNESVSVLVDCMTTIEGQELDSITWPNNSFALADIFVLLNHVPEAPTSPANVSAFQQPYAAECILNFCIQNKTATESNFTFTESNVGGPLLLTGPENTTDLTVVPDVNNWTFVHGTTNYTIDTRSVNGMLWYLASALNGSVNDQSLNQWSGEWPSQVVQSVYTHLNMTPRHLDDMFANIAQSMTYTMRMELGSALSVPGTAFTKLIVVRVEWAWVALPFSILALIFAFVITVALLTRHAALPPWKSSIIATLFHGLQPTDGQVGAIMTNSHRLDSEVEMRKRARTMMAMMRRSNVDGSDGHSLEVLSGLHC